MLGNIMCLLSIVALIASVVHLFNPKIPLSVIVFLLAFVVTLICIPVSFR